jgi:hypothetical protein
VVLPPHPRPGGDSSLQSGRHGLLNPQACMIIGNRKLRPLCGDAAPTDLGEFGKSLGHRGLRAQILHKQAVASRQAAADEQLPYAIRDRRICRLHTSWNGVLIDDGAAEHGERTCGAPRPGQWAGEITATAAYTRCDAVRLAILLERGRVGNSDSRF